MLLFVADKWFCPPLPSSGRIVNLIKPFWSEMKLFCVLHKTRAINVRGEKEERGGKTEDRGEQGNS